MAPVQAWLHQPEQDIEDRWRGNLVLGNCKAPLEYLKLFGTFFGVLFFGYQACEELCHDDLNSKRKCYLVL